MKATSTPGTGSAATAGLLPPVYRGRHRRLLRPGLVAILMGALVLLVASLLVKAYVPAAIAAALSLAVCVVGGYVDNWTWTGFGEYRSSKGAGEDVERRKTLWDILQLLIVPLALALLGYWVTDKQHTSDQRIADNQSKDAVLSSYLDRMSDLYLKGGLDRSKPVVSVSLVAGARTVEAMRQLDSERNRLLTQFLSQSQLLETHKVDLSNADLSDTHLSGALLAGARLAGTVLSRANLQSADLNGANLFGAHLERANLREANLLGANLTGAYLSHADLQGANLFGATMQRAIVTGAHFEGVKGADGAVTTDVTWKNTICPDGTNSDKNGGLAHTCLGHGFQAGN